MRQCYYKRTQRRRVRERRRGRRSGRGQAALQRASTRGTYQRRVADAKYSGVCADVGRMIPLSKLEKPANPLLQRGSRGETQHGTKSSNRVHERQKQLKESAGLDTRWTCRSGGSIQRMTAIQEAVVMLGNALGFCCRL